jgi:hypothetical protein
VDLGLVIGNDVVDHNPAVAIGIVHNLVDLVLVIENEVVDPSWENHEVIDLVFSDDRENKAASNDDGALGFSNANDHVGNSSEENDDHGNQIHHILVDAEVGLQL